MSSACALGPFGTLHNASYRVVDRDKLAALSHPQMLDAATRFVTARSNAALLESLLAASTMVITRDPVEDQR